MIFNIHFFKGVIMADSYSQIYIHIVFAVKGRENLLNIPWRYDVFKYISSIIQNKNHKPIIVNGFFDHIHCFIGYNPAFALSDLVRDIKNNSSHFINTNNWVAGKFQWQAGYGAFSYSHSQISNVYTYILNQENHHQKKSFKNEFYELLDKFNVVYDDKYLFQWVDV